ncbi:MAG: Transcriptional regulator PA2737, MerR family [uncultured Pyrinomonadaceae bacterium]|uniref:Transcriptional regulator PA2737, MerR family n=1 Tax=uncultured Pyrinomonadaceae bacterium TaxID=2283094 RepID=A0A6J4P3B7_9BACT|nr:MAG: Transcriptional regulator PA2737, MerR family [uncultured Pyrinomonadaceae bacterium]
MGFPERAIPEKIFFKIGEVCDLVGVQAHVLRYWETEFPMLSPQKNRSGQRSYRRRDVEIALRVKELLYDDLYTIAGAKKKLQIEMRESSRLKIVHSEPSPEKENYIKEVKSPEPLPPAADYAGENLDAEEFEELESFEPAAPLEVLDDERREALNSLAAQLLELREMLKSNRTETAGSQQRKY